jgi:vancomycin permeability regulator SanA
VKQKLLWAVLLAVLIFLAAAGAMIWSGLTDHLGVADVALVLGNKVNPDGSPSPRLKARLDTTVSLFRGGYFKKVIVSGGTGVEGVPEGTAMKRYLVSQGIPADAVIVDDLGVDTYASAGNTAKIMAGENWKSVLVITQYFHIPRSKLALSRAGIASVFNAHPSYFEARDVYSTVREIPAYVKYSLRPAEARPSSAADAR